MADEHTSEVDTKIASWLLKTTGAIWLAVLPAVGTAVAAVAEAHLSKRQLLCLAGAEAFSILALVVILRRAFARQGRALAEAKIAHERMIKEKKSEPGADRPVFPPLDAKCLAVLKFLANKSSGAWAAHVGYELKYSIGEVEFCFDRLLERKLIRQVRADTGSGAEYGVTPEGRVLLYDK